MLSCLKKIVPSIALLALTGLSGCASYAPRPLDKTSSLVQRVSSLDESNGRRVTLAQLDRLVLANNPDLIAARAKLGVSQAQILLAGILPNPQIPLSYPFFISGPGTTNAYSFGLVQDIKSILLQPVKREVAQQSAREISATLLWQEWQTIGKARLLFVDIVSGERAQSFLVKSRILFRDRFKLTNTAIAQGNATLATLSPDLVAVGDAQKTYDDLERQQLNRRHQLNALVGLAPDAKLDLVAGTVPTVNPIAVRRDLATLADRRPDLIALQYAYRSEDAKVRQAILAQFPNLSVGVTGGSDTSGILSFGPQLTIDLPIFDRNQGNIAVEEATREQLNREFSARITNATGEIAALLSEQALLSRQITNLEPRLREARSIAEKTENAFKAGTFDERAYVDIEAARLAREQEKIALQQSLLEGQVGLATLIGAGFPAVAIEPEQPHEDPFGIFHQVSQ